MTMAEKEKGHASFLTFAETPHLRRFFLGNRLLLIQGVTMPETQPDQISQIIASIFTQKGINPPFIETILLRDGFYVGRKYRAGGFQVVWWIEKNVVDVFDEDGQVVETIELQQKLEQSA
jgi:hypothetical protein